MRKSIISAAAAAFVAMASCATAGPATAALPQAPSQFAALRHAPTSQVPSAAKQFLEGRPYRGLGLDVSQTRRIPAPDGGSWDVTPGDNVICLFVESEQAGICTSTADALAGRLNIQFVQPSNLASDSVPTDTPRFQAGLLPDDAVSTTATASLGGATLSARPDANGLYRLASTGPVGIVTMHRAAKRSLKLTAAWSAPKPKPTAHAAGDYFDGIPPGHRGPYAYYTGLYGWQATITSISIMSYDGNTMCGNARNPQPPNGDGQWAGAFFCSAAQYWAVSHPYGGYHRSGWAGPGAPSASVLGGATEYYTSVG
jgi:hypothetical protein